MTNQLLLSVLSKLPAPDTDSLAQCSIVQAGGHVGGILARTYAFHILSETERPSFLTESYPYFLAISTLDPNYLKATAERILSFTMLTSTAPKIVIIEDAEKMTKECANHLLKTLEEPPKNTYFILTTSKLSRVLPTIRSRAVVYRTDTSEMLLKTLLSPETADTSDWQLPDIIKYENTEDKDTFRKELSSLIISAKTTLSKQAAYKKYLSLSWIWDAKNNKLKTTSIQDFYRYLEVFIEQEIDLSIMKRDYAGIQRNQDMFMKLQRFKKHIQNRVHKKAATLTFVLPT